MAASSTASMHCSRRCPLRRSLSTCCCDDGAAGIRCVDGKVLRMIDILWKIGSFAVVLGVLVVFHELGHYIVARLCGVRILRFSVGFGRVLWSRRLGADRTEWALSMVPLGGYVKMLDEREGSVAAADLALVEHLDVA